MTVTAAKPDLIQLQDIDFPSRVGPKVKLFGIYLRNKLGDKMANITASYRENPEMAIAVLVLALALIFVSSFLTWLALV